MPQKPDALPSIDPSALAHVNGGAGDDMMSMMLPLLLMKKKNAAPPAAAPPPPQPMPRPRVIVDGVEKPYTGGSMSFSSDDT
jgi:hypothetical protein